MMRQLPTSLDNSAKFAHPEAMTKLDQADRAILKALQGDSLLTGQALGERVNLSPSQAARRRQRLEAEGVITGHRAQVSPQKLGLTVQAFIQVQTATHTAQSHKAFLALVEQQPEIVAAWTLTGEADYLLRVRCTDLAALNKLVQTVLLTHEAVGRVQSQIVMDELKADAPLPM